MTAVWFRRACQFWQEGMRRPLARYGWIFAVGLFLLIGIFVTAHHPVGEAANVSSAIAGPQKTTGLQSFRSDEGQYTRQILLSMGFVVSIAMMGILVVSIAKRRSNIDSLQSSLKLRGVRMLVSKRVSPKLNILMVELAEKRVIAIADNGNSLLKLAEFDLAEVSLEHKNAHEN